MTDMILQSTVSSTYSTWSKRKPVWQEHRSNIRKSGPSRAPFFLATIISFLNADFVKVFTNGKQLGWCNVNGVLIISVG